MGLLDFFSPKSNSTSKSSIGQNKSSSVQQTSTKVSQTDPSKISTSDYTQPESTYQTRQFSDLTYPSPIKSDTSQNLNELDLMSTNLSNYQVPTNDQVANIDPAASQTNLSTPQDPTYSTLPQNDNSFDKNHDYTQDYTTDAFVQDTNNSFLNKEAENTNTTSNLADSQPLESDVIGGQTYLTNDGVKATVYQDYTNPILNEVSDIPLNPSNPNVNQIPEQAEVSYEAPLTSTDNIPKDILPIDEIPSNTEVITADSNDQVVNYSESQVVNEPSVNNFNQENYSVNQNINDSLIEESPEDGISPLESNNVADYNSPINPESSVVEPIQNNMSTENIISEEQENSETLSAKADLDSLNSSNLHMELKDPIIDKDQYNIKVEDSYQETISLKVFKKLAIVGLNNNINNPKLKDKIKEVISYIASSLDEIFIDSDKGHGSEILKEAGKTSVKLTGVYLRPTYSNFSDESEYSSTQINQTTIIYSNFIERLKFLIKEADFFIIPETAGLNNFSELFTLLSMQFLYSGQSKPIILLGKEWTDTAKSFKDNLKFTQDQVDLLNICDTAEEALKLIENLDNQYSKKDAMIAKKVIDKRDSNDENEFFL